MCVKWSSVLSFFRSDLKDNVSAVPLGLVFEKVNAAVSRTCHTTLFPGTNSVVFWVLK